MLVTHEPLQDECSKVTAVLDTENDRLAQYYEDIIQTAASQRNRLHDQIQAAKNNNLQILAEVQKIMEVERERILSLMVKVNDKKPYSLIREYKSLARTMDEMKSIPAISFEVAAFTAPNSQHVGGQVTMRRMKFFIDSTGKTRTVASPNASSSSLMGNECVSPRLPWTVNRIWQEYSNIEFTDETVRELKNPLYLALHLSGLLVYDSDSVARVAYPTGNEDGHTFLHSKVFKGNVSRVVGMWSAGNPVRDFIAQDRLLSFRLQNVENAQWYTIRNIWEGVLDCAFVNNQIYICKVGHCLILDPCKNPQIRFSNTEHLLH